MEVECNHAWHSKDLADIARSAKVAKGPPGKRKRSPIVPSFPASLLGLRESANSTNERVGYRILTKRHGWQADYRVFPRGKKQSWGLLRTTRFQQISNYFLFNANAGQNRFRPSADRDKISASGGRMKKTFPLESKRPEALLLMFGN